MAGKVSLPATVEIGFGAGPMDATVTWTDVSQWVQRSKTIACNRSIDTTTMTPGDGRGSLRLSNKDGGFTPGATGAFGLVRNRLPVRIRQGSTVVWTGLIEKWSAAVDGIRPVVDLTLVDRWPRMRQRVLTGDRILQVCQALAPENLWPLNDPAGSTRAVSLTSGWALRSLYGAAPGWGGAPDPHTSATGMLPVVHLPDETTLMGVWDGAGAASPGLYVDGFSVSMWVRCPSAGSAADWFIGDDILDDSGVLVHVYQSGLEVTSVPLDTGTLYVGVAASAGWRHVVATADFTGAAPVLALWLDGAQVYTHTTLPSAWTPTRLHTLRGSDADAAYAASWPRVLSSTEIQTITAAGLDALGASGQTPDVRAGLAAAMWPPTTLTTQGTFAATMSKQAIDGVSQADLLAACAVTEGGMLHIGTGGWPVLTARGARSDASLAATIPASVIETSAQWELDDTQVVNVATVERMALGETASTLSRRNDSSVADYGEVTKTVQGWWDTDAQAVERANTEVAMWADPSPRSKSFTVDLMTASTVISPATLLAVDIGSRILLTGLPSQTPAQTAAGWYVDGVDDQITHESWKRTFTVTPAIDFLVLDDATFGGLDEWPLG